MTGLLALAALTAAAPPAPVPLAAVADPPAVQVLAPGFAVRELPVGLTNINNVCYAPDGRLLAAGYDGRLHLLRDTDGDGLEDKVTTFHDTKSDDYPLGAAYHAGAFFVTRRHHVARHPDGPGGVPGPEEVAATGWRDPGLDADKRYQHRRIDDAFGLAFGPDGAMFVAFGAANYSNGYLLDKQGKSHLDPTKLRGVVVRFSPDGKSREVVARGVRYVTSMAFDRHGELFGTDQEGATWLPNGNPFDELLHLKAGRYYGFPPRHPKHLPGVTDEPSVFDYGPQHQSACGFRFNHAPGGFDKPGVGPAFWANDAIVTGATRGKLYRTKLARTPAGYVARNDVIGGLALFVVDVAVGPDNSLVLACHTGKPDWGAGPAAPGKLYKVTLADPDAPQPVLAHAVSPTETAVVFDRPLSAADWPKLAERTVLEGGAYVMAGDRFESFRPGYEVVRRQLAAPRLRYPVLSAGVAADGRTLLLRTAPRPAAVGYAVTLPWDRPPAAPKALPRAPGIDVGFDLTGVQAKWQSADGSRTWDGWLPSPDWAAAVGLTAGSEAHAALPEIARTPGTLTLTGQLDLHDMLRPAVQEGAKLDHTPPPEMVTVTFTTGGPPELTADGAVPGGAHTAKLVARPQSGRWLPFTLAVPTGTGLDPVAVSWATAEDPATARPLPLRRVLLPWAVPPGAVPAPKPVPELAGGDWAAGKAVFLGEKARCAVCHAARGEGGAVGPDLSNLPFRDYESVLRDVRQPSAAINPDYLGYVAELADGRTLTGITNGSTESSLKLTDQTGMPVLVPRADVVRLSPAKQSVMPEGLLDGLTPAQVRDLMTFLLTDPPAKGTP